MSQGGGSIDNREGVAAAPRPAAMLRRLVRSGVSFSGRERNCCFANLQNGSFGNISVASGLDQPDDGRGVAPVDWDHDGDLDVWFVNRSGPQVRFMRNETGNDCHSLSLKLRGVKSNRDGIGARVELKMKGQPTSQIQTMRAGNAYLSQASRWMHFGTDRDTQIEFVKVRWPGELSEQFFRNLKSDRRYQLTQGQATPQEIAPIAAKPNAAGPRESVNTATPLSSVQRILLSVPLPLPPLQFQSLDGSTTKDLAHQGDLATLVNLWATWCQPCVQELSDFGSRYQELQSAGITVVALSVDKADLSHETDTETLQTALQTTQASFPFELAHADARLLDQLQIAHDNLLDLHEPLPVPSSILLDKDGRLLAIYKGTTSVEQLISDAQTLRQSSSARRETALPFVGKWSAAPRNPRLLKVALDMLAVSDLDEMKEFTRRNQTELSLDSAYAVLLFNIGQQHSRRGEHQQAVELYKQALKQKSTLAPAYFNLGVTYAGTRQFETALVCFQRAEKHEPGQLDTRLALARTLTNLKRADEAVTAITDTIRLHPRESSLPFELAIALAASGRVEAAIEAYRRAAKKTDAEAERYLDRFKKAVEVGLRLARSPRASELRRALKDIDPPESP